MKAISNTTIMFGLAAIPVGVCAATSKDEIKFTTVGPNGEAVKQTYVNESNDVVPRDFLRKAFDGKLVPEDALKNIDTACKLDTLEIVEFIDLDTVPFARVTNAYYLQPISKLAADKPFDLLRDRLRENKKAAVTKWTARSKQQAMVIYESDGCLMANTLTFADNWREPDQNILGKEIEISDAEKAMADQLIEALSGPGESLQTLTDEAVPMKRKLIEQVLAGQAVAAPAEQPESDAVDMMTALEASVEIAKKNAAKKVAA